MQVPIEAFVSCISIYERKRNREREEERAREKELERIGEKEREREIGRKQSKAGRAREQASGSWRSSRGATVPSVAAASHIRIRSRIDINISVRPGLTGRRISRLLLLYSLFSLFSVLSSPFPVLPSSSCLGNISIFNWKMFT